MINDMNPAIAAQDPAQTTGTLLDMLSAPNFDEAQLLATDGHVLDALDVYGQIGAAQADRHYQDALILEQRNDLQGAISLLKWCVSANPEHFPAWVKLAHFLAGTEAEKACRRALDIAPGNLEVSLRLANLLIGRQRLLEAARALEAAHVPEGTIPDYDLQFGLAHALWLLGDFSAAEFYLRCCIQSNPADVRPYQTLLELLNRQDRMLEAETLCRDYLQATPADQPMRTSLAQALVRQQQWGRAETVLLDLLTESPGSIQLRQLYADMLVKCGRAQEALVIAEKNLELTPDDPEVYLSLTDIQCKSGDKSTAAQTCHRLARRFGESEGWGLHVLPLPVESRLIFYKLEAIAEKYCSGQRAIFDNTELDITGSDFEFGQVVEFFCMVTGQEHIDYLEHVAYPALSSTEGFDDLLNERIAIYNIYTTPSDFKLMTGFLDKLTRRGIRYRVNVELLTFSQELYQVLALPIIDQIKRSLALRSAVVMALPDAIISGSIHRVISDMKPFETVVCAMPRIDSDVAYPELKRIFSPAEQDQRLDSREFVRKSMTDFMHPQTHSALISENNCLRYRDQGGYFSARNWAPPPLCFYARPEMLDHMIRNPLCGPTSIASFYTIDHDVVDSAYRSNNLRLIGDSDYFFWAELTKPSRHTDFLAGRKSEDYYYPESAKHVFAHEFKWIYGEQNGVGRSAAAAFASGN